jgi:hypothetical protein
MLFTAWAKAKDGGVTFYSDSKAFAEFFPIPAQDVVDLVGPDGWRSLSAEAAGEFVAGLGRIFELVNRAEVGTEMSSK